MTHPGLKAAFVAGTAMVGLAVAGAFTPPAARADPAAPRSAADCRAISDFTLRGQCWDALDRANQKDAQAAKKQDFGLGLHPPSEAAVKPKKEVVQKLAEREKAELKDLTLTVASVGSTPGGRMLLTSTDGAIWEQTDGDAVPHAPAPGDTVKVSKGFLGGYMCQLTRWQSVRCQRDQ